jgi:NADPH:quinone reductase-like Zn-dependent oxidoreductase
VFDFGPDKVALGLEVSGVVVQVGSHVEHLAVGDRVAGIGVTGCLSTMPVLKALNCARIPDDLGFEDAAAMVIVYVTAIYALIQVARIEQGQVS